MYETAEREAVSRAERYAVAPRGEGALRVCEVEDDCIQGGPPGTPPVGERAALAASTLRAVTLADGHGLTSVWPYPARPMVGPMLSCSPTR